MKRLLLVTCASIALLLTGCITSGIDEDYLVGSEKLYDDISPKYIRLVDQAKDSEGNDLDPSIKESWLEPLKEWDILNKRARKAFEGN